MLGGGPGVWVVGGAVRDALLDREPKDPDFVVEGDAVALARRLGGPVTAHERFGTATVGGVDLASARRETYSRPGALPDVELGVSIDDDLARRDFTVNAIAVRLADAEVRAWPGALEDLEGRVLRVLHERSFHDDPTRLIRMARYAARLGFAPDPETARLAGEAVRNGALDTLTPSRVGEELRRLLREPQPQGLERLAEYGVGEAVLPGMAVDADRIIEALELVPSGMVALAVAARAVEDLRSRLDDLAFPAAERDLVAAAARGVPGLAGAQRPSEILRAVSNSPPEAVAVEGGPNARRWIDELQHVRADIDGNDLLAAGLTGRGIGAGLDAALEAKVDGLAPDRESQLAAALASEA